MPCAIRPTSLDCLTSETYSAGMDATSTTKVFRISEGALERFKAEFARIERRATKLGVPAPSYAVDHEHPIVGFEHHSFVAGVNRNTVKTSFNVTVTGHAPVVPGGWQLVATLDRVGDGNVIKRVPTSNFEGDVPARYRTEKPWCDHCNAVRRRSDTFLLVDEHGTWKQVGRQCLADFLGARSMNPAALAASFEIGPGALDLAHAASVDEDGSWGSSVESRFSLVEYLTYAVAIIRIHGWLSRREADDRGLTGCSTADSVMTNMRPRGARQEADAICPTDADEAKARDAIAWAAGFDPNKSSDFDFSMRAIAVDPNGTVEPKNFGIAAYIPVAHSRALAREAEAKAVSGTSAHFGEVGKRAVYEFTVVGLREMDSRFGLKTLVSFRDASGNVAKWFCAGAVPVNFELSAVVTVKATIKAHGEFRGVKETTLSRVSPHVPAPAKEPKRSRKQMEVVAS